MPSPRGLYLHYPFCAAKCDYCDFVSAPARPGEPERYGAALLKELAARVSGPVATVYFGGGTPSLAAPELIQQLLAEVRRRAELANDAEITLEANPATADEAKLAAFRRAGVNRLSVGVQSLDNGRLRRLGRIHTAAQAAQMIAAAGRAGFEHLSVDFIYGLPGQKTEEFLGELEQATAWPIEHLSLYALTLEAGTPLAARVARRSELQPDEDAAADQYEAAGKYLLKKGFFQYELSNYSLPGRACRHNLGYWTGREYVGLGVAAHSYQEGERKWNTSEIAEYLSGWESGLTTISGSEKLNEQGRIAELLIIGLRMTAGIRKADFARRFGAAWMEPFRSAIETQVRDGLLALDDDRLSLTPRGMLLANVVFRALV